MKDIDKHRLYVQIELQQKVHDFNLYKFVEQIVQNNTPL
jgi:hypothetical protein